MKLVVAVEDDDGETQWVGNQTDFKNAFEALSYMVIAPDTPEPLPPGWSYVITRMVGDEDG